MSLRIFLVETIIWFGRQKFGWRSVALLSGNGGWVSKGPCGYESLNRCGYFVYVYPLVWMGVLGMVYKGQPLKTLTFGFCSCSLPLTLLSPHTKPLLQFYLTGPPCLLLWENTQVLVALYLRF